MTSGNDHPFRRNLLKRGTQRALEVVGANADFVYAKMIDGRTIFQYFQLIEPVLSERHPYAVRPGIGASDGRAIAGSFDPRRLKGTYGAAEALVSRPSGITMPITGLGYGNVVVNEALALLDRIGLSFFVDLGLNSPLGLDIASSIDSNSSIEVARRIVEVSAQDFFDLVCEAELVAMAREADLPKLQLSLLGLARVFAWSVAREFDRRCGAALTTSAHPIGEFRDYINSAPLLPVALEMSCYWYPAWERSAFLLESALDMAPNYARLLEALDIRPGNG